MTCPPIKKAWPETVQGSELKADSLCATPNEQFVYALPLGIIELSFLAFPQDAQSLQGEL
jgi:hypothetical protein